MSADRIAIVIPARMGSTRFPGKPLADLAGKPMIQWVVEAVRAADITETILVATPDREIVNVCREFGAEAVVTRADHPSGTDRVAEIAQIVEADFYVNVQGDEPLVDADTIRACAEPLIRSSEITMSSVFSDCPEEDLDNPAAVKVVTDQAGYALYFSRFAVPFPRNPRLESVKKHVGIYGYRKDVLEKFARWRVSPLETTESLEQLRFLEHGVRIMMSRGAASEMAVDTPEQAIQVAEILRSRRSAS